METHDSTEMDMRIAFHKYLSTANFKEFAIPAKGNTYPSSHIEAMWQAWKAATLIERSRSAS